GRGVFTREPIVAALDIPDGSVAHWTGSRAGRRELQRPRRLASFPGEPAEPDAGDPAADPREPEAAARVVARGRPGQPRAARPPDRRAGALADRARARAGALSRVAREPREGPCRPDGRARRLRLGKPREPDRRRFRPH